MWSGGVVAVPTPGHNQPSAHVKSPANRDDMPKSKLPPIINRLSNPSNLLQWNFNIRQSVNQGDTHKALLLFRQMKQNGLQPNNLTLPFVAKACAKLSDLSYSQIFHTHVVKSKFQSDIYVQTAMVDMYVKCNELDCAYKMFERMPHRDIGSCNAMLLGFAQNGFLDRVSLIFRQIRIEGMQLDSVTVIGLTQSILCTFDVRLLNAIHCFGIRFGLEADVSISNTWVSAYAKFGDLDSAEKVFYGIGLVSLTVVSWNSLISGFACMGKSVRATGLYKRMLLDGFRPDLSTILNLLSSCCDLEALFRAKLIHSHGIKVGCELDKSVLNTLISMYCKCGDISSARYIFYNMTNKTCVSWTAMIGGYAAKGDLDEALTLFHAMEAAGEKPDLVTVLNLISGCGQSGALETGRWIDDYAISNGLKSNIMVCNALIDMYAKCGSVTSARELFYNMQERTIVSWTSMIVGCALNGDFTDALEYFYKMLQSELKPNHVTFLAVLQACNHGGFLDKGWECFNLMNKVYRLNPGIDHYSCMADLLGRSGKLEEALEFIHYMPMKPDAGIWGALLGACKVHHNVEIGEYAACHLFELEPHVAAPYVEMANIYASSGRWDGVAAIRSLMKRNQVTKSPGQSTIQVNGKNHTFTVEDRCHPEESLIFEALDGLNLLLKDELLSSHPYAFSVNHKYIQCQLAVS